MVRPQLTPKFWERKRVLVTGHTGFKGAWLCHWLLRLGAKVTGFALPPSSSPNLFDLLNLEDRLDSHIGDLRNFADVEKIIQNTRPDIVLHLAAQALVRPSYDKPLETFASNVMGTAHVLEAIRQNHNPAVCLVATTDKVYRNLEEGRPFKEDDPLGGHDPYSASKAATEIVISSYRQGFFEDTSTKLISVRAGNAIGGGDWSVDRIIPDAVRAWTTGETLNVRRPQAVRPWQHVLEPLFGYLYLSEQAEHAQFSNYNISPCNNDKMTVGRLIEIAREQFGRGEIKLGDGRDGPHEASLLQLDASRIGDEFGLWPRWSTERSLEQCMAWYKAFYQGQDATVFCDADIEHFMGCP